MVTIINNVMIMIRMLIIMILVMILITIMVVIFTYPLFYIYSNVLKLFIVKPNLRILIKTF